MLHLEVDIASQVLTVIEKRNVIQSYQISSASKGVGERIHSEQTPRGWHYIRAKIGANLPVNTVLVKRRPTGEIYYPELKQKFPNRDWILTRILWLCGLEKGKNRLGKVDTLRRFIYIHGTPSENEMGTPGSRGCIRMKNEEIIQLFNIIPMNCLVYVQE